MTRILAQYVSLETAALGLFELILSFAIIEAFLIVVPGVLAELGPIAPSLDANLTNVAVIFAVVTAAIATTIGLYRPEVCLERRRLVVTAAVAGIVAFPILLLLSGTLHISLTRWVIFWLALVLLVWQAGILATHFAFSAVVRRDGMIRRVLILGPDPPQCTPRRDAAQPPRAAVRAGCRRRRPRYLARPSAPPTRLGRHRRRPGRRRPQCRPRCLTASCAAHGS